MPMTHYPKNSDNLVLAWVQPAPPLPLHTSDRAISTGPDFLGRSFSEINQFREPINPGDLVAGYHDALPFTRFYGTIASDQSLEFAIMFSNDEVGPDGRIIRDDNIHELHYDGEALRLLYDPKRQGATGKFFVTIYGSFLCVEVKNTGSQPTGELRVYVRGSVF